MARPQSALTKLILTLPPDMPIAEVIEKAKAAGMDTTESNVSRVRTDQKRREAGTPAKKAAKKPAAKAEKKPAAKTVPKVAKVAKKAPATMKPTPAKKAAKTTPAKKASPKAKAPAAPTSAAPVSKSAFIRSQPPTMPARDVVEAARAAGITMTTKFVYRVRSTPTKVAGKKPAAATKAAPTSKPAPKAPAKPKAASPKKPAPTSGSDEVVTFRRLVLGLGVRRSRGLLEELELGLARLIGG